MNANFQQRLDKELLNSEKKRILIIMVIFSVAFVFRLAMKLLVSTHADSEILEKASIIWVFPFSIVLFEFLCYLYIRKRIKHNSGCMPAAIQYINILIEVSLPTCIIWFVAKHYPQMNVLHSPAVFIYFIFVILSTLRLNFGFSFFCGLLSCLAYASVSVFVYHHFDSDDAARAFILLFSGTAAGLVARQIRKGVDASLNESEKRHKVENMFRQQVSVEVAAEMIETDGRLESRKLEAAIKFIDIRNFSNYASCKTPEQIVHYQNAFFSIVIEVMNKYNGMVHQFLGDGCMISFGAMTGVINPSQYAVNAGEELLKRIKKAVAAHQIPPTEIGIGIHTGEVVTGNIGTVDRQQYFITGQAVILASRIEQLNKEYQTSLLISETVALSLSPASNLPVKLGEVVLKGWETTMSIYKLASKFELN